MKIIEKCDQKLVVCTWNVQNTLTTSWFVITMLCNKRVPKSLTLFYINTVDYTHLHHSLNTYFYFFLQFVTHYVTFKVRKSCFRWGWCLCVEITCKNLFVTSHGYVGGLDVVYFIIYKNMFTSLTTLCTCCHPMYIGGRQKM